MRLSSTLVIFSLAVLNLTYALHPRALRHRPDRSHNSESIAIRQHHAPREFTDICVFLGSGLSLLGVLLDLDVCLCLSGLELFVESSIELGVFVDTLGLEVVVDYMRNIIYESPGQTSCSYPRHSAPYCSATDVCGFTCSHPYYRVGQNCVCKPTHTDCNGQCVSSPQGCASPVPRPLFKRNGVISRQSNAQDTCKPGEVVCGVYGGQNNKFECLNVNSTLESCGGCVIPSPFQLVEDQTLGRDCSKIDGAEDVVCLFGQCVVRRCSDGWNIGSEGDNCVKTNNRPNSVLQINSADIYESMPQPATSNPHIAGLRHRSLDSLDTSITSLACDSDSEECLSDLDSEPDTSCTESLDCVARLDDDDNLTAHRDMLADVTAI